MGVLNRWGEDETDRTCTECGQWCSPWSMEPSRREGMDKGVFLDPWPAPVEYQCLSCRSLAKAG